MSTSQKRKLVVKADSSTPESEAESNEARLAAFFPRKVSQKQVRFGEMPDEWRTTATKPSFNEPPIAPENENARSEERSSDAGNVSHLLDEHEAEVIAPTAPLNEIFRDQDRSSDEDYDPKHGRNLDSDSSDDRPLVRGTRSRSFETIALPDSAIDITAFSRNTPEPFKRRRNKRLKTSAEAATNDGLETLFVSSQSNSETNHSGNDIANNAHTNEDDLNTGVARVRDTRSSYVEEYGVHPSPEPVRNIRHDYLDIPESEYASLKYPFEVPDYRARYTKREVTDAEDFRALVAQVQRYQKRHEIKNERKRFNGKPVSDPERSNPVDSTVLSSDTINVVPLADTECGLLASENLMKALQADVVQAKQRSDELQADISRIERNLERLKALFHNQGAKDSRTKISAAATVTIQSTEVSAPVSERNGITTNGTSTSSNLKRDTEFASLAKNDLQFNPWL